MSMLANRMCKNALDALSIPFLKSAKMADGRSLNVANQGFQTRVSLNVRAGRSIVISPGALPCPAARDLIVRAKV